MRESELFVSTGKSIVRKMHERNEKYSQDDEEYIPALKIVITGIIEVASKHNIEDGVICEIAESIKDYGRQLYLEVWLANGEEGENVEQATEDGIVYFNYIYEHEKHPR
jgi:hypothetical protein